MIFVKIFMALILLTSCEQANADKWQVFSVPGLFQFEYPKSFKLDPASGAGESKWSYRLTGENGIELLANGFHYIPEREKKLNETNRDFILRSIREKDADVKLSYIGEHVIKSLSVRDNHTVLGLIYLPSEDANGAAIKSMEISYANGDENTAQRIEKSWLLMKQPNSSNP